MQFKSLQDLLGYELPQEPTKREDGKLYLSLRLSWTAHLTVNGKLLSFEGDNGTVIAINKDEDPGEAMHVELMEYIKYSLINDKGIDPEADGECTMAIVDFGDVTVL